MAVFAFRLFAAVVMFLELSDGQTFGASVPDMHAHLKFFFVER